MYSSIGRAFPRQEEDPDSIPDSGHFLSSWYLNIHPSAEFSKTDVVMPTSHFLNDIVFNECGCHKTRTEKLHFLNVGIKIYRN